jgi:hypothetical protein
MKPKKKQETGQRMRSQVERTIRSRLGAAFCLHHLTSKVISHGANLRSQIERSKIGAAFACTYLGTPPQNAAILLHSEQQQEATGNAPNQKQDSLPVPERKQQQQREVRRRRRMGSRWGRRKKVRDNLV